MRLLALLLLIAALPAHAGECPRIVSQSPYITHTLQWLGLEPCIVGVSRYDHLPLPHTGGVMDPDGEALEALHPELWLVSARGGGEVAELLTPEGTRLLALGGFRSMAEVAENLLRIGEAAGMEDSAERAAAFEVQWRAEAARVGGEDLRALIITGCSGTPYAFGADTWLNELFRTAGFKTVDNGEGTRAVEDLDALIEASGAERLFTFGRGGDRCPYINPKRAIRVIHLEAEQFLHPAPVVIDGLISLRQRRDEWSR